MQSSLMNELEGLQAELLQEYSKTLDSSTILAILSDYSLSDPSELDAARQTLDVLSIEVDESADFDPSGASALGVFTDEQDSGRGEEESVSARSQQAWRSQTDDTSLSQEMSLLDLEGPYFSDNGAPSSRDESPEKTHISALDGLDKEDTQKALVAMFPALKAHEIEWMLKRHNGDASLAIDDLMTQSFLEESGTRHRGVDAFSESELPRRSRKGKAQGRKRKELRAEGDSTESPSPTPSKWDTGKQDVEFIVSKTGMPTKQVSSFYHNNGATLSATIAAIVKAHSTMKIESDDPMIHIHASELHEDFPSISTSDLEIIVEITHPSLSNARDLAKAHISRPVAPKSSIKLEFRHAPVDLGLDSPKTTSRLSNGMHSHGAVPARSLAKHLEARDTAFVQAHAAYRKGKSDPLMAGAAAYYSQVGRDNDAKAKTAGSAAADELVASQSTRTKLDLHGVNVKDAKRIAKERVTTWWHGLSDDRMGERGIGAGFNIVTGQGHHTEGGRGKLGPAVGKMLLNDGWKVEVGRNPGILVVTGIIKRK